MKELQKFQRKNRDGKVSSYERAQASFTFKHSCVALGTTTTAHWLHITCSWLLCVCVCVCVCLCMCVWHFFHIITHLLCWLHSLVLNILLTFDCTFADIELLFSWARTCCLLIHYIKETVTLSNILKDASSKSAWKIARGVSGWFRKHRQTVATCF